MKIRLLGTVLTVAQWTLIGTIVCLAGFANADASSSHYTSGAGQEQLGDPAHTYNPAHMWVSVAPPQSASVTVTSGGRYHDGCTLTTTAPIRYKTCRGANGGDYALDYGSGGDSYLKVDWAGWAGGASVSPKSSSNISIYGVVDLTGRYGSYGRDACQWQRYQIYIEWQDNSSTWHWDNIGWVVYAHQYSWQHSTTSGYIYPNVSHPRTDVGATGTVYYLNVKISTVYPYADYDDPGISGDERCSYGVHTHLESYSRHNWGADYEKHGYGPDYYYDYHVECKALPNGDCPYGPVNTSAGYAAPQPAGSIAVLIGGNTHYNAMW